MAASCSGNFTLCSTIKLNFKNTNKVRQITNNRLCRFDNSNTWRTVLTEVAGDKITVRPSDEISVQVSNNVGSVSANIFQPSIDEAISVVQDFDNKLKFATFTISREGDDDQCSDSDSGGDRKQSAFDVLMSTGTTFTKLPKPIDVSSQARFTGTVFNNLVQYLIIWHFNLLLSATKEGSRDIAIAPQSVLPSVHPS